MPQRGLLGAARLTPSASPYGRSNWLRQFVEPACCPSGVRIATEKPSVPRSAIVLAIIMVPQRGFEPLTHALRRGFHRFSEAPYATKTCI